MLWSCEVIEIIMDSEGSELLGLRKIQIYYCHQAFWTNVKNKWWYTEVELMLFDESSSLRYRPKYHVGCLVSFIERLLKIVHYCWEVFMISDFKKNGNFTKYLQRILYLILLVYLIVSWCSAFKTNLITDTDSINLSIYLSKPIPLRYLNPFKISLPVFA